MSFKYELAPGVYVARTHSCHPSRNHLIKICTRPLLDKGMAETEARVQQMMEKDPEHKYFVIKVEEVSHERTPNAS